MNNVLNLKALTSSGASATRTVKVHSGDIVTLPIGLLDLGHEVYASPATTGQKIDVFGDQPIIMVLLDQWALWDFGSHRRELPMWYRGTNPFDDLRPFAEKYAFEGRRLFGADLALFCESWRENTGIGEAPQSCRH